MNKLGHDGLSAGRFAYLPSSNCVDVESCLTFYVAGVQQCFLKTSLDRLARTSPGQRQSPKVNIPHLFFFKISFLIKQPGF